MKRRERKVRNQVIVEDYMAGSSIEDVMVKHDLSRRQVFEVLAACATVYQRRTTRKQAEIAGQAARVSALRSKGMRNKEIASELGVCCRTVDNLVRRAKEAQVMQAM